MAALYLAFSPFFFLLRGSNGKATLKAFEAAFRDWEMVPVSGLIGGVVAAVAKANMLNAIWLLPAGLAYSVCILGFRFNWPQKIVATIIMLFVTFDWQQIIWWLKNH